MSRDLLALSSGFSDRPAYSVQGFLGGPPGGESETPSRSYNYSIDLNVYPSTSPKRLFHRGKSPFRSKPSAGLLAGELAASLIPFLCQPRKDQRKS